MKKFPTKAPKLPKTIYSNPKNMLVISTLSHAGRNVILVFGKSTGGRFHDTTGAKEL